MRASSLLRKEGFVSSAFFPLENADRASKEKYTSFHGIDPLT